MDCVGRSSFDWATEQTGGKQSRIVAGQGLQPKDVGKPAPIELRDSTLGRSILRRLTLAVSAHYKHWPLVQATGNVQKQIEGCRVSPVQVVQEQDQRLINGDRCQPGGHGLKKAKPILLW